MVEVGETGRRGWGDQPNGEVMGSGNVAAGGRAAEDLPGDGHCWMAGGTRFLGTMMLDMVPGY